MVRSLAAVVVALVMLASTGASASWLSCTMSDQVMPNGTRCACVHETHESAVPALERLPCCTSVEIARAQVPPSSPSLHVVMVAPVLVEIPYVTRAPAPLAVERALSRADDPVRLATGPPIPVRLRHLLL